ncbi:thioredoxin [mine drainage metagenome]|uniref:Thioredoxin n=1 Tax=mine drainage metagenome TaxID=410659 RepID=A0A1J5S3V9_9ZZZZ
MKKIYSGLLMFILSSSIIACGNDNIKLTDENSDTTTLPAKEFQKEIAKADAQILDVRTMQEYQSGHIKNALLADWTNMDEFVYRTQSLDKSKPVYTYCLSGARSARAAQWLREKGFRVYNLAGGIAAWNREGLPLDGVTNDVKQISLKEYQSLIPANKTVLVDISATWCPPCKKMEPVIDSLEKMQANNFSVIKIDGGEQNNIVRSLNVTAFPTFIVYKNGKEIWKKQGIVSIAELSSELNLQQN